MQNISCANAGSATSEHHHLCVTSLIAAAFPTAPATRMTSSAVYSTGAIFPRPLSPTPIVDEVIRGNTAILTTEVAPTRAADGSGLSMSKADDMQSKSRKFEERWGRP